MVAALKEEESKVVEHWVAEGSAAGRGAVVVEGALEARLAKLVVVQGER